MQYTTNHKLKKPDDTDIVEIKDFNYNADIIDAELTPTAEPDKEAPRSNGPGKVSQWVSWITNRIKAITGKTNWFDAPDITLAQTKAHVESAAPHTGHVLTNDVVMTAAANKILKLNASGKLPASITGDADTVDGKHAADFATAGHNHTLAGLSEKSYNSLIDKPASLPANGGNADTVDGKHAADFALAGHNHTLAGLSEKSYNSLTDKPASLPANGGNADTVDGKHAADFALAGHNHTLASLSEKSYNSLTDKPASLPANGGNSDTVDGKHAADFATVGHNHTLAGLSEKSYNSLTDKPTSFPANGGNADTVDGCHAGNGPGNVLKLDGMGMVPSSNMPDITEVITEFVVSAGRTVEASDVVEYVNGLRKFELTPDFSQEFVFSGSTNGISICELSTDKVAIAYSDRTNSYYGTVTIGIISGGKIYYSSKYVFNNRHTINISICALSPDEAVLVYRDVGNHEYGTAKAAVVSGTTVTFGSAYVFNPAITMEAKICALSLNTVAIVYVDQGYSSYGVARVGTVTGTTITFGDEYPFNARDLYNSTYNPYTGQYSYFYYGIKIISGTTQSIPREGIKTRGISICALSPDKIAVAFEDYYSDTTTTTYGTAVIGTISGRTITFGNNYVFSLDASMNTFICPLSADKVVIAYPGGSWPYTSRVIVGTVSGIGVTFGTEHVFNPGSCDNVVYPLPPDKFIVAYHDHNSGWNGTLILGTVTGTTVTFGSKHVFNTGDTYDIALCMAGGDKIITVYRDESNSDLATVVIGDISHSYRNIIGIAKETKIGGDRCKVAVGGRVKGLSALVPGTTYYCNPLGRMTNAEGGSRYVMGVATSNTEMVLKMYEI